VESVRGGVVTALDQEEALAAGRNVVGTPVRALEPRERRPKGEELSWLPCFEAARGFDSDRHHAFARKEQELFPTPGPARVLSSRSRYLEPGPGLRKGRRVDLELPRFVRAVGEQSSVGGKPRRALVERGREKRPSGQVLEIENPEVEAGLEALLAEHERLPVRGVGLRALASAVAPELSRLARAVDGAGEQPERPRHRVVVRDREVGTVAEGKLADIIAVRGDVLTYIDRLQDVGMVIRRGVRYK